MRDFTKKREKWWIEEGRGRESKQRGRWLMTWMQSSSYHCCGLEQRPRRPRSKYASVVFFYTSKLIVLWRLPSPQRFSSSPPQKVKNLTFSSVRIHFVCSRVLRLPDKLRTTENVNEFISVDSARLSARLLCSGNRSKVKPKCNGVCAVRIRRTPFSVIRATLENENESSSVPHRSSRCSQLAVSSKQTLSRGQRSFHQSYYYSQKPIFPFFRRVLYAKCEYCAKQVATVVRDKSSESLTCSVCILWQRHAARESDRGGGEKAFTAVIVVCGTNKLN